MVVMIEYKFTARAEGLPIADLFTRSSDPYIVILSPSTNASITGEKRLVDMSELAVCHCRLGSKIVKVLDGVFSAINAVQLVASGLTLTPCVIAQELADKLIGKACKTVVQSVGCKTLNYKNRLHTHTEGQNEVFVSEIVKKSLNPSFDKFTLKFPADYVNHLSPKAQLTIQVWDWDRLKPSDFLGSVTIAIKTLLDSKGKELELELHNPKNKPAGKLFISSVVAGVVGSAAN